MRTKKKKFFLIVSVIATLIVTISTAFIALEEVRLVTVITLVAAAFGAGASVVSLVRKLREDDKNS